MKKAFLLAAALACLGAQAVDAQMMDQPQGYPPQTGYAPQPGYQPPPSYQQQPAYQAQPMYAPPQSAPPPQFCQPYADKFSIAGETRITRGTACLRPDGSWELHPQQVGMNYVNSGGGLVFIPVHPFAIGVDYYHHHHYHY